MTQPSYNSGGPQSYILDVCGGNEHETERGGEDARSDQRHLVGHCRRCGDSMWIGHLGYADRACACMAPERVAFAGLGGRSISPASIWPAGVSVATGIIPGGI